MLLAKETTYFIFLCQFGAFKKQTQYELKMKKTGETPVKNKGEEARWAYWFDASLEPLKKKWRKTGY